MWNPFRRRPSAFETEYAKVKELPEQLSSSAPDVPPSTVPVQEPHNWFEPVRYGETTPPVIPPYHLQNTQALLAAPPIIDRFPYIAGENLSGAYVSTAFRLANSGWRYQLVDLLDELLENDPDTRTVVRARTLGVASGRYNVEPAQLGDGAADAERDICKAVSDEFALQFSNIPYLRQRLHQLVWAEWYGASGHEMQWGFGGGTDWTIEDLSYIHSRRLNYTDPTSWNLYVYDQGLVGPGSDYMGPTVGTFGLAVAKYPGKFLIHTPALSGQYPTRDGEGRNVAMFMLMKRMITRCTAQDFERVIRPWIVAYYNRGVPPNMESPIADLQDLAIANRAIAAFGSGSMNGVVAPNSIHFEVLKAASEMSATEFLSFLTRAISKSLLGQAFTTEPGANGNLATAQVADKNTAKILEYGAQCLADTIRYGMAVPWLALRHPGLPRHFAPRIVADVSDLPTPKELMEMAKLGTAMDMAINQIDLSNRTTLKLVPPEDTETPRTRNIDAKNGPNPPAVEAEDEGTDILARAPTPPTREKPSTKVPN